MVFQNSEWYYVNDQKKLTGPLTLDELDQVFESHGYSGNMAVYNYRLSSDGGATPGSVSYSTIARIDVTFSPPLNEFYSSRKGKPTTILSGPNNGGKTLLLRQIYSIVGRDGYLISCNRFSQIGYLNTRQRNEHEYEQYFDNFIQSFYTAQQNMDDSQLKLEHAITHLKKAQREKLFRACEELLGNKFSLQRLDPDDDFSQFYVDMDGENLRYGSSGTRLLLTIIGILLNDSFSTILIDEPEISLSPRIQSNLAEILLDTDKRQEYFPHIRQLFIATHSHLFLDRAAFSNNFVVTKKGKSVSVETVQSVGDFHHLQFNMLGNDLESIFLPSLIVITEGDSDIVFLTKLFEIHFPEDKITVAKGVGDGGVLRKLNFLKEAFGDLASSPYRDRIIVVLDKIHSASKDRIEKQGIPEEHIIDWTKNGIEYYYPKEIVADIFHCEVSELNSHNLEADPIEINGIRKRKKELALLVAQNLNASFSLNKEIEELLDKIRVICR